MSRPPAKHAHLLYGNQPYLIDRKAGQIEDSVLGDEPRDFTYHRFDAEEMLRPGAPEGGSAGLDAFQMACESVPLLGERYLVRLDHLERVRLPARGAQTVAKRIEALQVRPLSWEGRTAWVPEDQLLPGERAGPPAPVSQWVAEVGTGAEGGTMITLVEGEHPEFLLTSGDARHLIGLKPFLQQQVKGNFAFADEADAAERAAAPSGVSAGLHGLLVRLIEQPPPGCWLLLTAACGRESELSRPLVERLRRHGAVEKFITYDDYQPTQWLQEEARALGLRLDPAGAELLVRLVGNDHGRLARELEKLSLLFGESDRPLAPEALLDALHADHHGSVFLIGERLSQRDLSGALDILGRFLEQSPREFPVLIGVLARFFRQLAEVHAYSRQGISDADLAGRLKVHPFIAKRIAGQAARFAPRELERILRALADLDRAFRTGGGTAEIRVRHFLHAVCAGAYARREPDPRAAGPATGSSL